MGITLNWVTRAWNNTSVTHVEEREPHIWKHLMETTWPSMCVCVCLWVKDYTKNSVWWLWVRHAGRCTCDRDTSKIQCNDDLSLKTWHTHSQTHNLFRLFEILFFLSSRTELIPIGKNIDTRKGIKLINFTLYFKIPETNDSIKRLDYINTVDGIYFRNIEW